MAYCRDGQGNLIRHPYWSSVDPSDTPWDIVACFGEFQYEQWQEEMLRMYQDAPPPTPLTRASRYGFSRWLKYVQDAEKTKGTSEEWAWPGNVSVTVAEYVEAFDHVAYAKTSPGSLVLYHFSLPFQLSRREAIDLQKATTQNQLDSSRTSVFYKI